MMGNCRGAEQFNYKRFCALFHYSKFFPSIILLYFISLLTDPLIPFKMVFVKRTEEDKNEIKKIVDRYKALLVRNGELVPLTDQIWTTIQLELAQKNILNLKPKGIRTAVEYSYHGINIYQRPQQDNDDDEDVDELDEDVDELDEDHGIREDRSEMEKKDFSITITFEDYFKYFKPLRREDKNGRYRYYLRQGWSDELYKRLKETPHQFPCPINFKDAKVGSDVIFFIGYCNECEGEFSASLERAPQPGGRAFIKCFVTFKNINHQSVRQLRGEERERAAVAMVDCNMAPSFLRKMQATKLPKESVPNLHVLQQAKHEERKSRRLDNDVMNALERATDNPDFENVIRNIGLKPFFLIYFSQPQISCFKNYVRKSSWSRVGFDATGGVVKKIVRADNIKTKNIYLYELTVRLENGTVFPVANFLSEAQDIVTIGFFLSVVKKAAKVKPNEATMDMSPALMNAWVKTFTQHGSLEAYLKACAKVIFFNDLEQVPSVYVRNDISHFVHLICKLDSLKNASKQIKRVYVRAICSLIKSEDIEEIKRVLKSIVCLATSKVKNDKSDKAFNDLIERIAGTSFQTIMDEVRQESEKEEEAESEEGTEIDEEDVNFQISNSPFVAFYDEIVREVFKNASKDKNEKGMNKRFKEALGP